MFAGRMTLLLGPPGAGKSTLLRALSGKLIGSDLKVRASWHLLKHATGYGNCGTEAMLHCLPAG